MYLPSGRVVTNEFLCSSTTIVVAVCDIFTAFAVDNVGFIEGTIVDATFIFAVGNFVVASNSVATAVESVVL